MNLYLVSCCYSIYGSVYSYDVYVLAVNYEIAKEKGLEKMKKLKYRFTEFVNDIRLIASEENYKADKMIVL